MKNFKKKELNSSNGITLIALVITIIVLLILAGISISMLTGNNGILTRAGDAKEFTNNNQIIERIKLAYHAALTGGQGSYTKESLEEELEKEFGENNYNVDDSDNTNWILSAKGQDVTIPAGKKGTTPNGKLSEEQLRTKIANETEDCMIDENGTIMPITAWDYYIDEEPYYIAGWSDYDIGNDYSGYHGNILEDGTLQYNIPVYIKKSDNLYKITEIREHVLYNSTVKSIKIPGSINTIGYYGLGWCKELTDIFLPNSITKIENGAFYNCKKLNNIILPDTVNSIGEYAFQGCEKLTSITIPNNINKIESLTFEGCSSLSSINIPSSVTSIGGHAFSGCKELNSITIPSNVTKIEEYAFSDCSKLSSINIPSSVTSIGRYAFSGCEELNSITIPNNVTKIAECTFNSCSKLSNINISNNITSIGSYAFANCNELASINIPNTLINMEIDVFQNWNSSQVINIEYKENEIPNGWNSRWAEACHAQINYAE